MILYTEKQLEDSYNVYRRIQIKKDMAFVSLDDFRNIFSKALRQNANRDQQDILGDHNLNPGMSIPEVSKPAAVLIPVIGRDQEPTILLTRRSDNLNHHAGQVSFPGGRHEKSDSNMRDTALRETEEEIGLKRDAVEVIGELPKYETRTGFSVKPIVGLIKPPFELNVDRKEVVTGSLDKMSRPELEAKLKELREGLIVNGEYDVIEDNTTTAAYRLDTALLEYVNNDRQ